MGSRFPTTSRRWRSSPFLYPYCDPIERFFSKIERIRVVATRSGKDPDNSPCAGRLAGDLRRGGDAASARPIPAGVDVQLTRSTACETRRIRPRRFTPLPCR